MRETASRTFAESWTGDIKSYRNCVSAQSMMRAITAAGRLPGQRKVNNRCSLARHSNSVARSLASFATIQLTHDALVAGLVADQALQDVVGVEDARDD